MLQSDGTIPKELKSGVEDSYFDEIVIQQENQIIPSFVLTIQDENLQELKSNWGRVVPSYTETQIDLRSELTI